MKKSVRTILAAGMILSFSGLGIMSASAHPAPGPGMNDQNRQNQQWMNKHEQKWQNHDQEWQDHDRQWEAHQGDRAWQKKHAKEWSDWYQWHHDNGDSGFSEFLTGALLVFVLGSST